mmetsp:Transcript_19808/g.25843  ORF Transcript_19808/g.25843 Transcript_19808/m.25843 type:complete len:439 (+) Transcript_19808:238-1554(+)
MNQSINSNKNKRRSDGDHDLNWREELNTVATQHLKERDELKSTIEKEANRQVDALMERRRQRKQKANQNNSSITPSTSTKTTEASVSKFGGLSKPIIDSSVQRKNNMSRLPSEDHLKMKKNNDKEKNDDEDDDNQSPVPLTSFMGEGLDHRSSPPINSLKSIYESDSFIEEFNKIQDPPSNMKKSSSFKMSPNKTNPSSPSLPKPMSPPSDSGVVVGAGGSHLIGGASSEWLKREWSQAQEDSASQIAALEEEAHRQQRATFERRVISAKGKGTHSRLGIQTPPTTSSLKSNSLSTNPVRSPTISPKYELTHSQQSQSPQSQSHIFQKEQQKEREYQTKQVEQQVEKGETEVEKEEADGGYYDGSNFYLDTSTQQDGYNYGEEDNGAPYDYDQGQYAYYEQNDYAQGPISEATSQHYDCVPPGSPPGSPPDSPTGSED